MNYDDRFARKRFMAAIALRKVPAPPALSPRTIRREALMKRARAFRLVQDALRRLDGAFHAIFRDEDPPADPFAYAMVRVKPRLPQLSRGATAELDRS